MNIQRWPQGAADDEIASPRDPVAMEGLKRNRMSLFDSSSAVPAPDPTPPTSGTNGGRIELFTFQARLVTRLLATSEHVLAEQPTGSGKTIMTKAFAAAGLGSKFSHVLIASPQQQIETAFVAPFPRAIAWPDGLAAQPVLEVPAGFIEAARNCGDGSRTHIRRYLALQAPDFALACTHAALVRLNGKDMPESAAGMVLIIDEGHHAPAYQLGRAIERFTVRGGRVIYMSATPYRADGLPVHLPGMIHLRRSAAEHMAEGFAPRTLESEIIALGTSGDRVTAAQLHGEAAPPRKYRDVLVTAIVERWIADGSPKAIVRIPPSPGGSASLVEQVYVALARAGARVLDATGVLSSDRDRFIEALEVERHRSWQESRIDIIIGIQRVLEGSDWKHCSTVYSVGIPSSLPATVQLTGRALRQKPADYPQPYQNLAKVVFFVPSAGGTTLDELNLDHSRHALLVCTHLADARVGQEWVVTRAVRQGIESGLGAIAETPEAEAADEEAGRPLEPSVRAEVELALVGAREELIADGDPEPTVTEVVEKALADRPDLPVEAFARVAVEVLAAQPGKVGEDVGQTLEREVARQLRIDPQVQAAMREAFGVVLNEFRSATLATSTVLETIGRQVHSLTGRDAIHFARRLRDAAPRPLTIEEILELADEWRKRYGEWPTRDSGEIPGTRDTWGAIDLALQRGGRNLPGGSSLARLLEAERGARNIRSLPNYTTAKVVEWADTYFKDNGEWPTRSSGPIKGVPGETWARVAAAVEQGLRGLPKMSSLQALLRKEKNAESNRAIRLKLPEEEILKLLKGYNKRHPGKWPTETTKDPVLKKKGLSWRKIDRSLREGARGLPGGSSIAKFLTEKLGIRNGNRPGPISEDTIWSWAKAHKKATGAWPTRDSGDVNGHPGEVWGNLDGALKNGSRGFPGGSSLKKLIEARRRKGRPS